MKSIELYNKLIERIDSYESRLLSEYRDEIACRAGCDRCCILESVFPVEAYSIYSSAVSGLIEISGAIAAEKGICVFLSGGRCSIYAARPVICRTHGYPVFVNGRADFCPENFRGTGTIDSGYILDLENLNRALASINLIFAGENTDEFFKRERIPLKELMNFIINK